MASKDSEKRRAYWNAWYAKNKDKLKEHYVRKAKRQKQALAKWLREQKEQLSCEQCKEQHPACLDFHHRDPAKKKAAISALVVRSAKRSLEAEMRKCAVMCSNCHRKLHYEEKYGNTRI